MVNVNVCVSPNRTQFTGNYWGKLYYLYLLCPDPIQSFSSKGVQKIKYAS